MRPRWKSSAKMPTSLLYVGAEGDVCAEAQQTTSNSIRRQQIAKGLIIVRLILGLCQSRREHADRKCFTSDAIASACIPRIAPRCPIGLPCLNQACHSSA